MFVRLLTVLVVMVASLLQPANSSSSDENIYIALGDSIAAGIGSSLPRDRSFPAILGDLMSTHAGHSVRTLNLAVPGESVSSFLADSQLDAFRGAVDEAEAAGITVDAVTLTLGGNDVLDLRDEDTQQREAALATFRTVMPDAIQSVVDTIGEDTPLYVSTLYDPTGENPATRFSDAWWIEQFNAVIRDAVAAAGANLVDLALAIGSDAQELTRYPADIHPTNDGHVRIAREFWRAIGIDQESPSVDVLSSTEANRFTPTLRFSISPDADLSTLSVETASEGITIYPPVEVSASHFAVLIDASGPQPGTLDVTVLVADAAGNMTEQQVELNFNINR